MKSLFPETHMPTVATVELPVCKCSCYRQSARYSCCSDRSVSTGTAGWMNYAFFVYISLSLSLVKLKLTSCQRWIYMFLTKCS
jgi:hypothetical protein